MSSEEDDTGVDDRSLSTAASGPGVRGGLSAGQPPSSPSDESECSDPNEAVMDSRFF